MEAFPKEGSGYPIRDFASRPGTEQTFLCTFLGRVNPNTVAARNQIRRLAQHQAAMQTQAYWNSICCALEEPGVLTAPG